MKLYKIKLEHIADNGEIEAIETYLVTQEGHTDRDIMDWVDHHCNNDKWADAKV